MPLAAPTSGNEDEALASIEVCEPTVAQTWTVHAPVPWAERGTDADQLPSWARTPWYHTVEPLAPATAKATLEARDSEPPEATAFSEPVEES